MNAAARQQMQTLTLESRAWRLLATLFAYPDPGLPVMLKDGSLQAAVSEIFAGMDPTFTVCHAPSFFIEDTDHAALGEEYVRLFYFGERDTPLCSLYEGEHRGNRMEVMEEVLRFYGHFGLSATTLPNEMPDHLVTELEFLHFLSFQRVRYIRHGHDDGPFRRASTDFLSRHANRWMRHLGDRVATLGRAPFYQNAGLLLARFMERFAGTEIPMIMRA